jgi:hypothetical protein
VKMARQSVAVEAAAPSPRTTAWGDGVGRRRGATEFS